MLIPRSVFALFAVADPDWDEGSRYGLGGVRIYRHGAECHAAATNGRYAVVARWAEIKTPAFSVPAFNHTTPVPDFAVIVPIKDCVSLLELRPAPVYVGLDEPGSQYGKCLLAANGAVIKTNAISGRWPRIDEQFLPKAASGPALQTVDARRLATLLKTLYRAVGGQSIDGISTVHVVMAGCGDRVILTTRNEDVEVAGALMYPIPPRSELGWMPKPEKADDD